MDIYERLKSHRDGEVLLTANEVGEIISQFVAKHVEEVELPKNPKAKLTWLLHDENVKAVLLEWPVDEPLT